MYHLLNDLLCHDAAFLVFALKLFWCRCVQLSVFINCALITVWKLHGWVWERGDETVRTQQSHRQTSNICKSLLLWWCVSTAVARNASTSFDCNISCFLLRNNNLQTEHKLC